MLFKFVQFGLRFFYPRLFYQAIFAEGLAKGKRVGRQNQWMATEEGIQKLRDIKAGKR